MKAQIVMGSQASYEGLIERAQQKEMDWWSCGKNTKDGDLLLIYFKKPISKIVASATASGDRKPDKDWRYRIDIKDIELIEPPIALEKMRETIPEWGWPKSPRCITYLKEAIAKKLLKLANLKRESLADSLVRTSRGGAGFGTAEQNRIVEQAARKAVRLHYARMGYKIVSREKENLGYDFDVSRHRENLHVEVKGISGSDLRFPITANEIACARSDTKFRLAIVTEAISDQKRVHEFSRKRFLNYFDFKPLMFFAEAKSSLSV
ncbi:MAG TPA: DUF3883 domain-containing protein [Candidatus Acidoferrum sp.]|nr:DUF3883 domain-containing protein [Candidatus Acidoferrum sp.]